MSNSIKQNSNDFQLLKPKNDVVFQKLFNKDNPRITKAFVEALLDKKVDKIVINEDKELIGETLKDKTGILDLQLDIDDEEKVDVEVQLINRSNFTERLLFYFSKLYIKDIDRGDDYTTAKRVILIAIIDYELELAKTIEKMETIWSLREKEYPNLMLTDLIEIHIIELEKVRKIYEQDKYNAKAQWMLFLDDPNSKEVLEIMEKNEEIKEAVVEVHKMSEDEKMQRIAYLRQKAILDEKAIYKAGLEQRDKEIVQNMLSKNISVEQISELTGIDIEKVRLIANRNN